MEQKTPGFSALVTIAVLGVLTVVAWLYKIGKNEEARVLQSEVAQNIPPQPSASPSLPRERQFVPTTRQNLPNRNFEVLLGCELVESRANDGNTFRIRHRDSEHVIRLYFVDTPETTTNNADRIRGQIQYFNYITEEQLLDTGKEAQEFALKILRSRPFTVFTQWEKLLQSHRYHGMIQVKLPTGEQRFLSELLASRGYATLDANGRKLPNGVAEDVYRAHLRQLELVARKSSVGAWRNSHQ